MVQKFDYYDLLGIVVPGTLLICWVPVCFPQITSLFHSIGFPEAFAVLALIALAFLVGQLVQAVASIIEPLLYWTWGGRPSDRALRVGLGRYLPSETASRVRACLERAVQSDADDHSLFLFAIQRSDAAGVGRASRFNCLYAYHRGLFVLMLAATLLFGGSIQWGAASQLGGGLPWVFVAVLVGLSGLVWHRAKQRAMYYVREVLLSAERALEQSSEQRGSANE